MKSNFLVLSLIITTLFAGKSALAETWLESVQGEYICADLQRETSSKITIASNTRTITVYEKDQTTLALMIDETESLAVMQREVGFKQFALVVEKQKAPHVLFFKTSSGKLLMKEINRSEKVENWNLPGFTPELVCDKAI